MANRAFAIFSPADSNTDSTDSSYIFRVSRKKGSTFRASAIKGSVEAATAASPPSTRDLRNAGSANFDPRMTCAATSAGFLPSRTALMNGSFGPSWSRDSSSDHASRASSYSGYTGRSEDTRLNSSHSQISYAVFCLKKKKKKKENE